MELSVLNIKGEDTGRKVILNDAVFGIKPNDHAIYLDVKQFMANKRQGTHKAKERGEVSGSTKKLGRPKGSGGARRGSIKSPILVGGGRAFGPRPRDYSFKVNKKEKQLARKSALSYKVKENALIVIEDFTFEVPKTKKFVEVLNNLKVCDKKSLFVLPESNKVVSLSAHNLQGTKIVNASSINTYSILNADALVVTEGAIEVINSILDKKEA